MKNVLVTGATGFIGRNVVKGFLNKGYDVTATDIYAPKSDDFNTEFIQSDITKKESLIELVKDKDLIVNVAGLVDLSAGAKLLNAVNHIGVRNLCEAAKGKIKRFVQVSSIGVYGNIKKVPVFEDDEKKPKNDYEKSKWEGEKEAFKYSDYFDVVAVRPSAVYGIGSLHNSVLPMLNMLKRKSIPYFKTGPKLSHIHVEDVARAILFVAERKSAKGEVYNLADDKPLTGYEMFNSIAKPLGLKVKPILPYSKSLLKIVKFIAQKLPGSLYRNMSKRASRKWELFRKQHNLKQGLKPIIDPVWLDYLVADKVYSSEKLIEQGFWFKHPDAEKGLRELVMHYIEGGYLSGRR